MKQDDLGSRMKGYENAYRIYLPKRLPILIRIDGKAFHTYTKGLTKPWSTSLELCMDNMAIALCEGIQGAQIAYIQSDEVSLLVHNYKTLVSEAWFNNNLQKIISVSTSIATRYFNKIADGLFDDKDALFDCRVWVHPENEVNNYFIWRQNDCSRNSISMLAQSLFSHRELQNKGSRDLQDMCFSKGHNWHDLPTRYKRGRCVVKKNKWQLDEEIPIFSQDRDYINTLLKVDKD